MITTPPALVLFDLDGTLVDSAPDIARAADRALADAGLPTRGLDTIRSYVGNGAPRLIQRCISGDLDGDADTRLCGRVLSSFFDYYSASLHQYSTVYPGVTETLQHLHQAGIPLACVTNKPERYIAPLLHALGLANFFRVLVGGDTVAQKKPAADPLRYAAEQCGEALDDAVMIGDSVTDIHAARAAGIPVVCVSYGYHHNDLHTHEPDAIVDHMADILPLLAI